MSSIRKLKRYKSLHKKQKTLSKLSLGEIVFYVGIATMLFGLFYGIFNYNVYISDRPERIPESKGGPIYNPEEAPGSPGRRESATAGWTIA